MKFEDYEFGFADATKELTRTPKIFEEAFYDPRNVVKKLLNSYEFLLNWEKRGREISVQFKNSVTCKTR